MRVSVDSLITSLVYLLSVKLLSFVTVLFGTVRTIKPILTGSKPIRNIGKTKLNAILKETKRLMNI